MYMVEEDETGVDSILQNSSADTSSTSEASEDDLPFVHKFGTEVTRAVGSNGKIRVNITDDNDMYCQNSSQSDVLEEEEEEEVLNRSSSRKKTQGTNNSDYVNLDKAPSSRKSSNNSRKSSATTSKQSGTNWPQCDKCGGSGKSKHDVLHGDSGSLLKCASCSFTIHENCQSATTLKQQQKSPSSLYYCPECTIKDGSPPCHYCNSNTCSSKRLDNFDKKSVMFRCYRCYLYTHMTCLLVYHRERDGDDKSPGFTRTWTCSDCNIWSEDVEVIYTFRGDDLKEYFVKFSGLSHIHDTWVSKRWLGGLRSDSTKLRNFIKKVKLDVEDGEIWPKKVDEVVKPCWRRVEKILQVEYHGTKKKSLKDVSMCLIKWEGLPFEQCSWEEFPEHVAIFPEGDGEGMDRFLRSDIIKGLELYKKGITLSETKPSTKIPSFVEKKTQPGCIVGGTLKDYQMEGLNWLLYQWHTSNSCILADDMGLGKTIQLVSLMSVLVNEYNRFPFLIIVPTTTIPNWVREFSVWAPSLLVAAISGSKKARDMIIDGQIMGEKGIRVHAVIASYEMILAESSFFSKIDWELLVCDEGHRLKNDSAKTFTVMKNKVRSRVRVLMTGTPLQNNLKELYNLMHFLDPVKFNDHSEVWEEKYSELNEDLVLELHEELKPYFLRRTKRQVLKDLPLKVEVLVPVTLTPLQKKLYKAILQRNSDILRRIGAQISNVSVDETQRTSPLHNVLMELRKICGHPYLLNDVDAPTHLADKEALKAFVDASGKLILLKQMLFKLKERGHRVLIFSQFKLVLDILEDFLDNENHEYCRLDGSTPSNERQQMIDDYNDKDSKIFIFLLTTRTGGIGINLAGADTIIIYDADWNPHQDLQAIARAHRIGQTRPVVVYKFFTRNCVEERIIEIGKKKLVLDHLIVESMDTGHLNKSELSSVIQFGAAALFSETITEEIKYDDDAVEKLLNRDMLLTKEKIEQADTKVEDEKLGFSFAKVWTCNDGNIEQATLSIEEKEGEEVEDVEFWNQLLKDSETLDGDVKPDGLITDDFGRTRRNRGNINYAETGRKRNYEEATSPFEPTHEDDSEEDEYLSDNSKSSSTRKPKVEKPSPSLDNLHQQTIKKPVIKRSRKLKQPPSSYVREKGCRLCKSRIYHPINTCPKRLDKSYLSNYLDTVKNVNSIEHMADRHQIIQFLYDDRNPPKKRKHSASSFAAAPSEKDKEFEKLFLNPLKCGFCNGRSHLTFGFCPIIKKEPLMVLGILEKFGDRFMDDQISEVKYLAEYYGGGQTNGDSGSAYDATRRDSASVYESFVNNYQPTYLPPSAQPYPPYPSYSSTYSSYQPTASSSSYLSSPSYYSSTYAPSSLNLNSYSPSLPSSRYESSSRYDSYSEPFSKYGQSSSLSRYDTVLPSTSSWSRDDPLPPPITLVPRYYPLPSPAPNGSYGPPTTNRNDNSRPFAY